MQVWSLPEVLAEGRLHRHVTAFNAVSPLLRVLDNGPEEPMRPQRMQDTS